MISKIYKGIISLFSFRKADVMGEKQPKKSEENREKIKLEVKREFEQAVSDINYNKDIEVAKREVNDLKVNSVINKIELEKNSLIEMKNQEQLTRTEKLDDLNTQLENAILENNKEEVERLLIEITK